MSLRMFAALSLVAVAAVVPLLVAGFAPPSVFAPGAPAPADPARELVRGAAAPPVDVTPPGIVAVPSPPVPSPEFVAQQLAALEAETTARLTDTSLRAYASIAGWPADLHDELITVAWCESRLHPMARNGVMRGLMQVHQAWFSYAGEPLEQWADPVVNLHVAYDVYRYDIRRGYTPWTQWACKPDGTVRAASNTAAGDPAALVSLSEPETDTSPTPDPSATAEPEPSATTTATPGPWDHEPAWPPPNDGDEAKRADTPTPSEDEPAAGDEEPDEPEPTPSGETPDPDTPSPTPIPASQS